MWLEGVYLKLMVWRGQVDSVFSGQVPRQNSRKIAASPWQRLDSASVCLVSTAFAMIVLRYTALLLVAALTGCSYFYNDMPTEAQEAPTPPPEKKSSFWPVGHHAPQDATASLEYQRTRTGADKSSFALLVRNTHLKKTIEGDVRTTIETGPGQSKVETTHFTLAPSETKQLLVYPKTTQMTYEVTAFFKE